MISNFLNSIRNLSVRDSVLGPPESEGDIVCISSVNKRAVQIVVALVVVVELRVVAPGVHLPLDV